MILRPEPHPAKGTSLQLLRLQETALHEDHSQQLGLGKSRFSEWGS